MDISGQDFFGKVRGDQEWALTNLIDVGAAHGPGLFVARRVLNPVGSLAGMIVMEIDGTRLGRRALAIHRTEGGGFALFDREGRMVFSSLPQELGHLNWLDDDQMLAPALAGQVESGIFVYPTDKAKHLTAHVPVFNLNSPDDQGYYVVLASRPEALALSEVYKNLGLVVAINLLVIGISLVGATFLGRRITVPLGRLLQQTQSIGRGDL